MINTFSFGSYILVYNGQIYNTKELSETLKENGFTLNPSFVFHTNFFS